MCSCAHALVRFVIIGLSQEFKVTQDLLGLSSISFTHDLYKSVFGLIPDDASVRVVDDVIEQVLRDTDTNHESAVVRQNFNL